MRGAMTGVGRVGVRHEGAHARLDARSTAELEKQALLPLESYEERRKSAFEESTLGGANKMAAPCIRVKEAIIISSDEEERQEERLGLDIVNYVPVLNSAIGRNRVSQYIPRIVSPMLHKVQEWEVENQNIFRVGEQIEFIDSSGLILRGSICGETSGDGEAGRAQVSVDFWQSGLGAPHPGCDGTHALGERGEQAIGRLGRPANVRRLPVRVRAPSGHRVEERVLSGAVRLTTREATGPGMGGQDLYPRRYEVPSTSRGAGVTEQEVLDEEHLDYEEEEEVIPSCQQRAVQVGATRAATHGEQMAVQSDRRCGSERQVSVAGNLPRGEKRVIQSSKLGTSHVGSAYVKRISSTDMGIQTGVSEKSDDGIDVSVQVGLGETASKSEVQVVWWAPTELVLFGSWGIHLCVGLRSRLLHVHLEGNWVWTEPGLKLVG
ncbi:hypothetical protein NDU88_009683 [Pleurodeles waltl]|uniref:Uncharacterized protein n=1 Tax=Pleurodeles waltl TaxID=8319 RepID=A0AAV7PSU4_PLEWA|nr:hypothetical protein NDU88_009683 [Pleurodeles waltl]